MSSSSKDIGFYLRRPECYASAFFLQTSQKNTKLCLNTELCMGFYLPKRNFKRRTKRKKGSNQKHYKSATHRKFREAYKSKFPLCQIAEYYDDIEPGHTLDHIVPIEEGGAMYDERNVHFISKKMHDIKSALEGHHGILVDYTRNQDGDFIPLNKSDIWKRLEKNYKLMKLKAQY